MQAMASNEGTGVCNTAVILDRTQGMTYQLKYQLLDKIGRGGFGEVYTAISKPLNGALTSKTEHFAVKRILTMGSDARLVMAELNGEISAIGINSPYVNSPLAVVQSPVGWDVIFPELFDAIICRALVALNSLPSPVHQGDFKPQNFLCSLGARNGKKRVALSDFGLAYTLTEAQMLLNGAAVGTRGYRPPEALLDEPYRSTRSETYCAALVVLYWLGGCDPSPNEDGSYDWDLVNTLLPPESAALLRMMLDMEPLNRPSHEQLALMDPMRSSQLEPAAHFADTIVNALNQAPPVMGLPILNSMFSPSGSAPVSGRVAALLNPDASRLVIPRHLYVPTMENMGDVFATVGFMPLSFDSPKAAQLVPQREIFSAGDVPQKVFKPVPFDLGLARAPGGESAFNPALVELTNYGTNFIDDSRRAMARQTLITIQNEARKAEPTKLVSEAAVETLARAWMQNLKSLDSMKSRLESDSLRVSFQVYVMALRHLGGYSHGPGARKWFHAIMNKRELATLFKDTDFSIGFKETATAVGQCCNVN